VASVIKTVTWDCADALVLARFWAHFDLRAPGSMDAEVSRLAGLGASVVRRDPDLTVMRDPEGNEFCVEPGPSV
jgi:Glyoxalase-like domain